MDLTNITDYDLVELCKEIKLEIVLRKLAKKSDDNLCQIAMLENQKKPSDENKAILALYVMLNRKQPNRELIKKLRLRSQSEKVRDDCWCYLFETR